MANGPVQRTQPYPGGAGAAREAGRQEQPQVRLVLKGRRVLWQRPCQLSSSSVAGDLGGARRCDRAVRARPAKPARRVSGRRRPPSRRAQAGRVHPQRAGTSSCRRADRAGQAVPASTCHSDRGKAGRSLSLAAFDAARIVEQHGRGGREDDSQASRGHDAAAWRAAARGVGRAQRSRQSLESRIDARPRSIPIPGSGRSSAPTAPSIRTRCATCWTSTSTSNAYLPPDTISHGFDNVADAQTFSPTLMEGYLRAASQISRLAVGDRQATRDLGHLQDLPLESQMRHVEGAPMGTRGGIAVTHIFPADGDYIFKMSLHYEPLGGLIGRSTMATFDIHGAGGSLDRRRARGGARSEHADERDRTRRTTSSRRRRRFT